MKKTLKILFIINIIFIMINIIYMNKSFSASQQAIVHDEEEIRIVELAAINPDDYNPSENLPNNFNVGDTDKITKKIGVVLGAVRNISAIVAVMVLMVMGFKYMMGSAEEKANYKTSMFPFIIGCVMAVAGTTIVSFIYNMLY